MKKLLVPAIVGMCWLLEGPSLQAQFLPASSNAIFWFAQLADGGPPNQRWRSVFRLVNPITIIDQPVTGTLWFFDPQGNPLPLDFGNGPVTSLQVNIPARGAIQLQTAGISGTLRTGSVVAQFDSPVQAVEEFQAWTNGLFAVAASVNGSGLTFRFETFADNFTGIAVANPSTNTMHCSGGLVDGNGNTVGVNTFTLPGRGQVSFVLGIELNLTAPVAGSYTVSCNDVPNPTPTSLFSPSPTSPFRPFVALTLAGNSFEITSSMPPGNFALPSFPHTMIWNAFSQLVKALNNQPNLKVGQPKLQISTEQVINAFFDPTTNTVTINLALVEILADSPSEVAFVIAHELGHAHQFVSGSQPFDPTNPELDADQFALFGQLLTGYDTLAAGGALGKLMMALQATGLVAQQWENQYDPHTSFPNRMGVIILEIQTVCALPEARTLCQQEHILFHPDTPASSIPLSRIE